ncbi:hypothetical protein DFA_11958 [Cavenderia fasciculata]|uniref:Uncharacterized protein n=1 Tax=Cavenderia fasciculata TaxID=261658 RepID=F4QEY2_CACFS|nr:uncharacterized protein DFA_11958 [Cavenderia fasciculata]EGG14189.1 hypothetical protein DFA_11958 [Cavenderia fasciculata]|eukprot:XP_004350897.1 hypothetical protein DFA_11958 [Cavenderia fasciculata]
MAPVNKNIEEVVEDNNNNRNTEIKIDEVKFFKDQQQDQDQKQVKDLDQNNNNNNNDDLNRNIEIKIDEEEKEQFANTNNTRKLNFDLSKIAKSIFSFQFSSSGNLEDKSKEELDLEKEKQFNELVEILHQSIKDNKINHSLFTFIIDNSCTWSNSAEIDKDLMSIKAFIQHIVQNHLPESALIQVIGYSGNKVESSTFYCNNPILLSPIIHSTIRSQKVATDNHLKRAIIHANQNIVKLLIPEKTKSFVYIFTRQALSGSSSIHIEFPELTMLEKDSNIVIVSTKKLGGLGVFNNYEKIKKFEHIDPTLLGERLDQLDPNITSGLEVKLVKTSIQKRSDPLRLDCWIKSKNEDLESGLSIHFPPSIQYISGGFVTTRPIKVEDQHPYYQNVELAINQQTSSSLSSPSSQLSSSSSSSSSSSFKIPKSIKYTIKINDTKEEIRSQKVDPRWYLLDVVSTSHTNLLVDGLAASGKSNLANIILNFFMHPAAHRKHRSVATKVDPSTPTTLVYEKTKLNRFLSEDQTPISPEEASLRSIIASTVRMSVFDKWAIPERPDQMELFNYAYATSGRYLDVPIYKDDILEEGLLEDTSGNPETTISAIIITFSCKSIKNATHVSSVSKIIKEIQATESNIQPLLVVTFMDEIEDKKSINKKQFSDKLGVPAENIFFVEDGLLPTKENVLKHKHFVFNLLARLKDLN